MIEKPYTYTDPRTGSEIFVYRGGFLDMKGHDGDAVTVGLDSPDRAVALAESVLATGVTGWHVLSDEAVTDAERAAARSMRERAAEAALDDPTADYDVARQIRALPLLPDGAEVAHSGCPQERSETPSEQPAVHVATPEGITPCGHGTRDVTTSPLIPEVTCVECLQAIAMEKGGQVIAMRRERDRLRTAWESARHRARLFLDRATEARTQLDEARRWGRILEAQRKDLRKKLSAETDRVAALRIAYQAAKDADLPETDMVEPGDEVSDRVGALEQQYTDLADLVHGHGEDLARVNDVARELGEALKEHIQVNIDAVPLDPVDALAGLAKTLRSGGRLTAEDDG